MELLRDFTNRPGMTFDVDKTYILYAEDLAQIKENFDLSTFSQIYCYGDSGGDKEMLELTDERFYKHFK